MLLKSHFLSFAMCVLPSNRGKRVFITLHELQLHAFLSVLLKMK